MYLTQFLLEQIAIEEQAHRDVLGWPDHVLAVTLTGPHQLGLTRCDSNRRIVELHADRHICEDCMEWDRDPCPTLRLLGLQYSHLPGYRKQWRPEARRD